MSEKHPHLRIIGRALEHKGTQISDYLSQMLEGVDMNDPASVLRASQDLATNFNALMFKFRDLAGKNFDLGITQQFRSDVERLWRADSLRGFARDLISAYAEFEPVEKAAVEYFRDAEHHAQRSERYVMPILPGMNWKYNLGCLRGSLQKKAMEISSVGGQGGFRLVVDDEFNDAYLSRKAPSHPRPIEEPYALCGVHGGRDTDGYKILETLNYLRSHNRRSLTFTEAVLFYTAHPRFLLEQERVILLEEEYTLAHGMVKYVFLSSPHSDYTLHVGLVSKEEADKYFVMSESQVFHGKKFPRYGKPSTATIVISR